MHEQLALHIEEEVGLLTKVKHMSMDEEWPAVYTTHPVVTSNPDRAVIPYAIFVDGVPYANHDAVIGWWAICLVTQKRFSIFYFVQEKKQFNCCCFFKNQMGFLNEQKSEHNQQRYNTFV